MNKKAWLNEAKQYIDSLSTEEFVDFLVSCDPYQVSLTDYTISDIEIGRIIHLSKEAANSDNFWNYSGNIAA